MLSLRKVVVLCSIVAMLAIQPSLGNSETMKPGGDFSLSNEQRIGGSGGSTFDRDPESVINNGPISQIIVCGGRYIDSIQLFYGGLAGKRYGGSGGTCQTWKVPKDEHITTIFARSARFVDNLKFQTNKGTASDPVGGSGGTRSTIQDGSSGYLRTIQVKHGAYVDSIKFQFGLPYFISNMKYDADAINQQLARTQPAEVSRTSLENPSNSSLSMTANLSFEQDVTRTWDFGASMTLNVSEELDVGIPGLGDSKTTIGMSATASFNTGYKQTGIQKLSWSETVAVNPHSHVNVIAVAKKTKLTIPFSYTMNFYKNNKSNIISKKNYSGTFTNVQAYSVDIQTTN